MDSGMPHFQITTSEQNPPQLSTKIQESIPNAPSSLQYVLTWIFNVQVRYGIVMEVSKPLSRLIVITQYVPKTGSKEKKKDEQRAYPHMTHSPHHRTFVYFGLPSICRLLSQTVHQSTNPRGKLNLWNFVVSATLRSSNNVFFLKTDRQNDQTNLDPTRTGTSSFQNTKLYGSAFILCIKGENIQPGKEMSFVASRACCYG